MLGKKNRLQMKGCRCVWQWLVEVEEVLLKTQMLKAHKYINSVDWFLKALTETILRKFNVLNLMIIIFFDAVSL